MEELIKQAIDKGFKPSFMCTTPMKYSTKENIRQLFIMVEIQQWLRDNYDVHVNPQKFFINKEYYSVICYKSTNIPLYYRNDDNWHNMGDVVDNLKKFTYEGALKVGLAKALQMIGGKTT